MKKIAEQLLEEITCNIWWGNELRAHGIMHAAALRTLPLRVD
jgi:hypothetical protein